MCSLNQTCVGMFHTSMTTPNPGVVPGWVRLSCVPRCDGGTGSAISPWAWLTDDTSSSLRVTRPFLGPDWTFSRLPSALDATDFMPLQSIHKKGIIGS